MPHMLDTRAPGFEAEFATFLAAKRAEAADVSAVVAGILNDVRTGGDAALIALTQRFDHVTLTPQTLPLSQDEITIATAHIPSADRAALEQAAVRIRAYHERQMPQDAQWTDAAGAKLGWRWQAMDSVGLYVPACLS